MGQAPAMPTNTNNEASIPFSFVDVSHMNESWSNSHHEDPMGLSSSGGLHHSHRRTTSLLSNSSHHRVPSLGDSSQLLLAASSSGEQAATGVSSAIHDAARIANWQTVEEPVSYTHLTLPTKA